jgi:hypothetical protein
MTRVPGRLAVSVLTAAYGVLVIVVNARNDVLTTDFTTRWVLVGGRSGFPGDFGRSVLGGSVALGVLIVVVAAVVWLTAGRPSARLLGGVVALMALLLVATYRQSGNLLAARPGAAAVLLAVAFYLVASSLTPTARHADA